MKFRRSTVRYAKQSPYGLEWTLGSKLHQNKCRQYSQQLQSWENEGRRMNPPRWKKVAKLTKSADELSPPPIGVPYGRMKITVRAGWRNRTGEMWTPSGCYLQWGGGGSSKTNNQLLSDQKKTWINQWQRSKNMCSHKIIRLHTLKSTLRCYAVLWGGGGSQQNK